MPHGESDPSKSILRKQNAEILRSERKFQKASQAFFDETQKSPTSDAAKAVFILLTEEADSYFRCVEKCVGESIPSDHEEYDAWIKERIGDSVNVLNGILEYYETIRDRRNAFGFPASMFEPSPARFHHMQALLLREKPSIAETLKEAFEKCNLPVVGFDVANKPLPENFKQVVIVLHGINTHGTWQKNIASYIAESGFIPELLDYGRFSPIKFLIPSQRRRQIEWFRDAYERIFNKYNVRPHIIAHSFGSFIAFRAVQIYAGIISFKSVILCGCLLRRDFNWTALFENNLVERVLNDCGKLDIWAGMVHHFVSDAGPSGRIGFSTPKQLGLTECFHPEWGHSDFFFDSNFRTRWCPYLSGVEIDRLQLAPTKGLPWGLIIVVAVIFFVLIYLLLKLAL